MREAPPSQAGQGSLVREGGPRALWRRAAPYATSAVAVLLIEHLGLPWLFRHLPPGLQLLLGVAQLVFGAVLTLVVIGAFVHIEMNRRRRYRILP